MSPMKARGRGWQRMLRQRTKVRHGSKRLHILALSASFCVPIGTAAAQQSLPQGSARRPSTSIGTPKGELSTGAQLPPAPQEPDRPRQKRAKLDEVIVTARRVRTKLQDTPVADTVYTARVLQLKRIQSIADVALRTPSTSFIQISQSESYVSIRGTLVDSGGPGYNNAVTTFLDDVPLTGFGDANPDIYDLASVEVLRGPQGTLFGRNVTGGAVLLHTAPPTFTPAAETEVSYGTNNYIQARAMVNGPIVPGQLAGRVAVDTTNQDDDYRNVTLNNETGGTDVKTVRGELLWTPNSDVRVTLGTDYLRDLSSSKVVQLDGDLRPSLFPYLTYNPRQTNQPFNSPLDKDTGGAFLRTEWTMDWAQFTSITGYRHVWSYYPFSQLGDPTDQAGNAVQQRDNQVTQEIHLSSLPGSRVSWLGGLFLMQTTDFEADNEYAQPNLNVVAFAGGPLGAGGPFEGARINYKVSQRVTDRNIGLFGEATYPLTDTLKATVGGRYTYETKEGVSSDVRTSPSNFGDPLLNQIFASVFTPRPFALVGYNHDWDAFTPKFNLSYQPQPNYLLYGTIARGFKSGGYDTSGAGITVPPIMEELAFSHPFAPETVWSYEVGQKWAALHNRLQINTALYLARYKNLQVQQLVIATGQQQTSNAGSAQSAGVEVEALARPLPWLQTGVNYAYNDAHYTNYVLQNGPGLAPSVYTGNRLEDVPRHNAHLFLDTNFSVAGVPGSFLAGGDITYRSAVYFRSDNVQPQFVTQHSVIDGLVNAYVTWESDSAEWRFSIFGKNLTNQFADAFGLPVSVYYLTPAEYANPRNAVWISRWNPRRLIGFTLAHYF